MSIDSYTDEPIKLKRAATDAFGRVRVSEPVTLFDYASQYDKGLLFWEEVATGGATASFSPSQACVDLSLSVNPSRVIRQTKAYHRYQPGKSQFVLMTYVFGAQNVETRQRLGYFDSDNGIFLQLSGSTLQIVRRTKVSGSVVDNAVSRSSWNLDTMADLDLTKAQIFYIALEWLGVGSVECGFVIDGAYRPAHLFKNANTLDAVYMQTANLPVRYEMENSGTASTSSTMKAICCAVISEGGFETARGIPVSVSNGVTDKPINARKPILSIRPAPTFNGITNRSTILLQDISVHSRQNSVFVEVLYNATLTDANFAAVSTLSTAQFDTAATSVSGGLAISSFYVPSSIAAGPAAPSSPGGAALGLGARLPITVDISGSSNSVITIAATAFSATASVSVSIGWQELR